MNAQIKKGVFEMCILHHVLSFQPIYGYELIQKMNCFYPEVNESTFYSVLRRLNKCNFLSVVSQNSCAGPPRKYYYITKEGKTALDEQIKEWGALVKIVKSIGIGTDI